MRNLQREKINSSPLRPRLHWHERVQDIPSSPNENTFTMVIAHEFFDALPIHLFEKRPGGYREIFVDIDMTAVDKPGSTDTPPLRYVASSVPTLASNLFMPKGDKYFSDLSEGARVEVCPEAYEIAANSAGLLGAKGAGLVIDYGGERHFGNSFRVGSLMVSKSATFAQTTIFQQAFKSHRIADPLVDPGYADLTSNVNFSFIREALTTPRPALCTSASTPPHTEDSLSYGSIFVPVLQSQRSFLLSLGLQLRVQKLLEQAKDAERRQEMIRAAERLVDKNEKAHGMGKVFKVMAFVPKIGDGAQEVFPFGEELD